MRSKRHPGAGTCPHGHGSKSGFSPRKSGNPSKHFNGEGDDIMEFITLKGHSGCSVENRKEGTGVEVSSKKASAVTQGSIDGGTD